MDQETFTALVRQGELTLYRVAKAILHHEEDVEDAVQEGLLKAYQNRNKLKNEAFFQTWLTRIIINECYSLLRKNKPVRPFAEEDMAIPAPAAAHDADLYQAIRMLPPKIRITIVLYYVEGYSTAEIKTILKIPQGTVKSRLAKGRKLLKSILTDEREGDCHGSKTMEESLS